MPGQSLWMHNPVDHGETPFSSQFQTRGSNNQSTKTTSRNSTKTQSCKEKVMMNNKPKKSKQVVRLPQSWEPTPTSIICGRGSIALEHEGNQRLRVLVKSHLKNYSESQCKFQKSRIVSEIVETVRRGSPDGGFVKFVDDGWVQVSERHSREKVGQMFRDCLHSKYKSSTQFKAQVRRSKTSGDDSSQSSSGDGGDSSRASTTNHKYLMLQASHVVQPLPECPPSMIRGESLFAPTGNSLDNYGKMDSTRMYQQACQNPLNLSNFQPSPIDESTLDELFAPSFFTPNEPLPLVPSTAAHTHPMPSMENLALMLFDDSL